MHLGDLHTVESSGHRYKPGNFVLTSVSRQVTVLLDYVMLQVPDIEFRNPQNIHDEIEIIARRFLDATQDMASIQEEYALFRDALNIAQRFIQALPWSIDDVIDPEQLGRRQKKDVSDAWKHALVHPQDCLHFKKLGYLQKGGWTACEILESAGHMPPSLKYENLSLKDRDVVDRIREYDAGNRRMFTSYVESWAIHPDHHNQNKTILEALREKFCSVL